MRNLMVHVPHREKKRFAEKLKQIWLQPDIVGIFPNRDAYIRLVTTYVLEYTEDRITGKSYFVPECILAMEPIFKEQKQKIVA